MVISVQVTPRHSFAPWQSFRFVADAEQLKQFVGKTVSDVQITEVTSHGMDPVVLRLKISFSDGSFLEVDRKCTRLADSDRKIVHLDLAYQAK